MTKSQSLVFRVVLFLFGAGVMALAFFLNTWGKVLTDAAVFTWLSIGIMYLFFFTPFFFSTITIANFSGKIPSLPIVWTGVIGYIIASIIVIILLSSFAISLNTAITVQAVLVFLFAVCMFLAFFASSHARQVGEEENKKTQFITELKARSQVLSLAVNRLPAEYENDRETIKRTLEEIKYISPVNGFEGFDLEFKIMDSLNEVSDICDSIAAGGAQGVSDTSVLEKEAGMLQMLVKERKLLRN
ncbi:MAG: hypothetical protein LBG05_04505 [Treponema sp.]|jgi:hypothetical protein|nr:hypothetical protein [Treponema sp.]